MLEELVVRNKLAMVVVDSMSALFRSESNSTKSDFGARNRVLSEMTQVSACIAW